MSPGNRQQHDLLDTSKRLENPEENNLAGVVVIDPRDSMDRPRSKRMLKEKPRYRQAKGQSENLPAWDTKMTPPVDGNQRQRDMEQQTAVQK